MNQSDLQIVEDFNSQCQDIDSKVDKLVKYLSECLNFEIDSEEKEVEVLKCIQQGIDNFDLYMFIDFIEENQAQNLQNIISEYYSKMNEYPKYQVIKEKLVYYLNTCENRLSYLQTIKKVLPKPQHPQQIQLHQDELIEEQTMDIEYRPLKLNSSFENQNKYNVV